MNHNHFNEFALFLAEALDMAERNNHRLPVVFSGNKPWLSEQISNLQEICKKDVFFFSDQNWNRLDTLPWKKASKLLGQSIDGLILDLTQTISANALGIVTGALSGGGLLIFLVPPAFEWQGDSSFHKRTARLLKESHLPILSKDSFIPGTIQFESNELPLGHEEPTPPAATVDQQKAITAIKRVLNGHRRRPLVITADRGRGKSAALGIAASQLMQDHDIRILVTGPSRKTADTLFLHSAECLPDGVNIHKNTITSGNSQLQFIAPDELASTQPDANMVMVDEAAAIPAPLLEKLLRKYSRIVFASTVHGYEGTGRGFAIRFRKTLDTVTPKWQRCELNTPIRWSANDPVEDLVAQVLLLNAEPASDNSVTAAPLKDTQFSLKAGKDLIHNEPALSELFGLLVNAHYQTRPDDLVQLLDREDLSIATLSSCGNIIATALISHEGGFNQELATQIWAGKRRPQGHLLPQTLAAHGGFCEAPALKMARVMRIAVHPAVQRYGLGRYLMDHLKSAMTDQGFDVLGSSFGATPELLSFWKECNFRPVHIGSTRNNASGCHSAIVTIGLSELGKAFDNSCRSRFQKSLPLLCHHVLSNLETPVLLALFTPKICLTHGEVQNLQDYCNENRTFDATLPELSQVAHQLLPSYKNKLSETEIVVFAVRLLQCQSWDKTVKCAGLTGRKEAEQVILRSVKTLLNEVASQKIAP
ncbi:GNAT family N-acetyltransferase [Parendozoicomonas sp. Alg238-R29]|uniref:tRNA(Met) cytidine acetyltransferase TmcA n=1 Tax=Parendozoicomonas sp. Alg238-R29 TaxID=2993446 RepID=UPI00248E6633|nr:GNAT family N-acetyltransferase [Parendozoicomonas sp. Alg238-R29]